MPILGAQAIQQFQLITVNTDNIISVDTSLVHRDIINELQDVFEGKTPLRSRQVSSSSGPACTQSPFSLKETLRGELDQLVKKGMLVPVDVPTDWISSMIVATRRNGKIRLCIDPKPLNKALKRNRYPVPLLDDLLTQQTNVKVFSVINAKIGFWNVQLDDESSMLTTFGAPWGRYR